MRNFFTQIIIKFNLNASYYLNINLLLVFIYYLIFLLLNFIVIVNYGIIYVCAEPAICQHDGHSLVYSTCDHDWRPIHDGETCTCCICGNPDPDLGCKEDNCDCAIHDACDN
jgi:hypothetical protein